MKARIQIKRGSSVLLDGHFVSASGEACDHAEALHLVERAVNLEGKIRFQVVDVEDAPHEPAPCEERPVARPQPLVLGKARLKLGQATRKQLVHAGGKFYRHPTNKGKYLCDTALSVWQGACSDSRLFKLVEGPGTDVLAPDSLEAATATERREERVRDDMSLTDEEADAIRAGTDQRRPASAEDAAGDEYEDQ